MGMKIDYDKTEIEAGDLIEVLETYAKAVMYRMQKAEPDLDYCWTACLITFSQLQPEFQFGSAGDLDEDDGIYVEQPLINAK